MDNQIKAIIDDLQQSLFESAVFSGVKLAYSEIKQISGEPVTEIYFPIDVVDDNGTRHSASITVSRKDESTPWTVRGLYLSNCDELSAQWNESWNDAIWEMVDEIFPEEA